MLRGVGLVTIIKVNIDELTFLYSRVFHDRILNFDNDNRLYFAAKHLSLDLMQGLQSVSFSNPYIRLICKLFPLHVESNFTKTISQPIYLYGV